MSNDGHPWHIGVDSDPFAVRIVGIRIGFLGLLADCTTCYYTTDALGSTRMVTDQLGNPKARFDYLPFGQELGTLNGRSGVLCGAASCYSETNTSTQKFTGKERDGETGLDFFEARYFGSAQGRFASPDPMLAKKEWLADPQRWNAYAYVRNSPLRYIDPNGEDLTIGYAFGSDLSAEDLRRLKEQLATILAAIKDKFEKAGVEKVNIKPLSELTADQIASLDKNNPFGFARLTFVGSNFPGIGPINDISALGYAEKGVAAVFTDHFPRTPPQGCGYACITSNVAAHEIGHVLGFDAPGHDPRPFGFGFVGDMQYIGERIREFRGGPPDLMLGGRGVPDKPMYFNTGRDRNQRVIQELNRIGDTTPQ